jgi:hypothetical protein
MILSIFVKQERTALKIENVNSPGDNLPSVDTGQTETYCSPIRRLDMLLSSFNAPCILVTINRVPHRAGGSPGICMIQTTITHHFQIERHHQSDKHGMNLHHAEVRWQTPHPYRIAGATGPRNRRPRASLVKLVAVTLALHCRVKSCISSISSAGPATSPTQWM